LDCFAKTVLTKVQKKPVVIGNEQICQLSHQYVQSTRGSGLPSVSVLIQTIFYNYITSHLIGTLIPLEAHVCITLDMKFYLKHSLAFKDADK